MSEKTLTFKVEVANKISGGRAVGNLYGVGRYEDGRRLGWAMEPQEDEEAARSFAASQGSSVRATLRRVLPEGSTVWISIQHVTRSGRTFVLPQAFFAHEEKDPSTTAEFWSGAHIASRRYVLGREFCEALGYTWNREHMGWEGNQGEDAGACIVAALGVFAWGEPAAYSHRRIS